MTKMQFETDSGPISVAIDQLVIAGWTGRDADAVQHHIDELAALGVAAPSQVPLYYQVAAPLLTQADQIQVLGGETSGEVEPMIVSQDGRLWLGLASDHTDRALEVTSVAASKQVCAKPCAARLWAWEDVVGHLDWIVVESWIEEGGGWVLYQQGTLAAIRTLPNLLAGAELQYRAAMLCGTFAALGGVRPAARFRARMYDPVREAEITLSYEANTLPVVS